MNVQALLTADNHLDPAAVNFGPSRFERRRDHLRCFEEAIEYAVKNRPDLFLLGGDLFDSVRPSNATRATVMNLLRSLSEKGVRTFLVSGHHDTPKSVDEAASPLAVYGNSSYAHFFANTIEPETVELKVRNVDVSVVGLSHNPLGAPGQDPLSNQRPRPRSELNILLTHYPIQGFTGWIGYEPVIKLSSIPSSFQLVASGHFHNFQAKQVGRAEIIYPGSTERVTFAEEEAEKGFVWLEFNRSGITSKEFIRTSARPYRTVRIEFPDDLNVVGRIKEHVEKLFDPNLVLRVRLYGKATVSSLSSYRRPEVISFCEGRVFHVFVEEDELIIQTPEAPEPLPHTTPLQEVRRYFQRLMGSASSVEMVVLQEALQLSESRLEEAGAW